MNFSIVIARALRVLRSLAAGVLLAAFFLPLARCEGVRKAQARTIAQIRVTTFVMDAMVAGRQHWLKMHHPGCADCPTRLGFIHAVVDALGQARDRHAGVAALAAAARARLQRGEVALV